MSLSKLIRNLDRMADAADDEATREVSPLKSAIMRGNARDIREAAAILRALEQEGGDG